MMTRLRALGLSLLLMIVSAPGFTASNLTKLAELAATVQPGTFVELEIDGDISTCEAMVPTLPKRHPDACTTGQSFSNPEHCLVPQTPWKSLGNILEFTDEALWDPVDREVYIMGTRRPYKRWDQGFAKYSEETNSWTILDLPPFGVGAHGYDNGAIDVVGRRYYWSRISAAYIVWSMNLDTGEWQRLPDAPIDTGEFSAIDFFPELNKLVFFDGHYGARSGSYGSEYSLYDPNTNKWEASTALDGPTAVTQAPFGAISHFSEYNPSHGVMFFGGGYHHTNGGQLPDPTPGIDESRRFYMLDKDRVVTRLADAPTKLGQHGEGPLQTIDPNSGNLVVFQGKLNDGSCPNGPLPIWEYDLEEGIWNQTGEHNLSNLYCDMDSVVVPLYEYGVNFIVSVRNNSNCRVHLYRHSAMEATLPSITTQPASQSIEEGSAVTFSVAASGSGPLEYQWFRNGDGNDELIVGANSANFTIEPVMVVDDGARYRSKATNSLGDVFSNYATLSVVRDETAPTLTSAMALGDTRVDILFSETVNADSAENSAHYEIDLGISVTSATLNGDGRTVSLAVSQLTEDMIYTVQVSNVQDSAQTPNTITAQSSRTFTYRTADGFEDGNADGWNSLNTVNWEVALNEGDMAYYLNTTDFDSPGGGRLGEYSLLSAEYDDFTFTLEAKLGDDVADNAAADYAVVFGFQDANNYYYMLFNNDQNLTQLFKVINGSRTLLETANSGDWLNDNAYHSIEVKRIESAISVRFDGNVILNANDGSLGAGKVGVGSYNDSAYFDDVNVTSAVSGGGSSGGGSTGGGSTGGGSTGGGSTGGGSTGGGSTGGGSTGGGSTGGGSTGGGSTGGGSTGGGSTGGSSSGGGAAGDDEGGGGALSLFSGLALLLISAGRLRRRVRLCHQL
ncbi:MAG: immunoglobulin domain-containing protein [Gammaproteobacteria bacterium]|nr:immunoglobulin domain-containing protein [Gammaproteobacteria bacterium]